jgi:hypothetical protein
MRKPNLGPIPVSPEALESLCTTYGISEFDTYKFLTVNSTLIDMAVQVDAFHSFSMIVDGLVNVTIPGTPINITGISEGSLAVLADWFMNSREGNPEGGAGLQIATLQLSPETMQSLFLDLSPEEKSYPTTKKIAIGSEGKLETTSALVRSDGKVVVKRGPKNSSEPTETLFLFSAVPPSGGTNFLFDLPDLTPTGTVTMNALTRPISPLHAADNAADNALEEEHFAFSLVPYKKLKYPSPTISDDGNYISMDHVRDHLRGALGPFLTDEGIVNEFAIELFLRSTLNVERAIVRAEATSVALSLDTDIKDTMLKVCSDAQEKYTKHTSSKPSGELSIGRSKHYIKLLCTAGFIPRTSAAFDKIYALSYKPGDIEDLFVMSAKLTELASKKTPIFSDEPLKEITPWTILFSPTPNEWNKWGAGAASGVMGIYLFARMYIPIIFSSLRYSPNKKEITDANVKKARIEGAEDSAKGAAAAAAAATAAATAAVAQLLVRIVKPPQRAKRASSAVRNNPTPTPLLLENPASVTPGSSAVVSSTPVSSAVVSSTPVSSAAVSSTPVSSAVVSSSSRKGPPLAGSRQRPGNAARGGAGGPELPTNYVEEGATTKGRLPFTKILGESSADFLIRLLGYNTLAKRITPDHVYPDSYGIAVVRGSYYTSDDIGTLHRSVTNEDDRISIIRWFTGAGKLYQLSGSFTRRNRTYRKRKLSRRNH